ncbi:MAG: sugar O-acyltransferase (sialic acid O-acetyltransferase NeuD family) [Marivirga sp.]|jgi:sugar O-acyltransferase (sialic acid O-acetyltransferase NeuD family)
MIDVAIVGAGGFGKEVNLIIQQLIKKGYNYRFLGFYDDKDLSHKLGRNYLGDVEELNKNSNPISVIIAIGDGMQRQILKERITNPMINYLTLISPFAILNDIIKIGEGSIICAGANLTTDIEIGDFVVVNLNATVGHDVVLNDYCSIMPGVNLAGEVNIGRAAFIGSGATVLNGLTVGNKSILGAGAVLTKDLAAEQTAVGVPAKVVAS